MNHPMTTGDRSSCTAQPVQPVAERFPALEEQEMVLHHFAPEAQGVAVAGSFNGWNTEAAPMSNTGDGEWTVSLRLKSGLYEYRFVEDGRWCEDSRTTLRVANPFGGFNSVLPVPLAVRTDIL